MIIKRIDNLTKEELENVELMEWLKFDVNGTTYKIEIITSKKELGSTEDLSIHSTLAIYDGDIMVHHEVFPAKLTAEQMDIAFSNITKNSHLYIK